MNQSICIAPTSALIDGRIAENCTWSSEAIEVYCSWRQSLEPFRINLLTKTYWICQTFLVPFGIVGNLLLFLTLHFSRMQGVTFQFLRLISLLLLCQALASIGSTFDGNIFKGTSYISTVWAQFLGQRLFPTVMRFCKTNVCILSMALTTDRYLALNSIAFYSKIRTKTIFVCSSIASLLVSSLEFIWLAEVSTDQHGSSSLTLNRLGIDQIYLTYIIYILVILKVIVIVVLIVFSLRIVSLLKTRGRQISNLTKGSQSNKEFEYTAYLARFQLIDAALMLVDVGLVTSIVYIFNRIRKSYPETYSCSFFYVFYVYRPIAVGNIVLGAVGDCVMAYAHGGLFLFYLIFLRKFYEAFVKESRRVFRCGGGQVGQIIVQPIGNVS